MSQVIKKAWGFLNTVLIGMVALFVFALVGVRLFGVEIYTVLSGSMEPMYQTGSIIYVVSTEPEKLEVGDVITFYLNEDTIATHRIVEVVEKDGEKAFRTKGDANNIADGFPVKADEIIGKPVFTIPGLGYLAVYIQSPSGRYTALVVGMVILIMLILPDFIFKKSA